MRNSPRFAPERTGTPLPATNGTKLDKSMSHNKKKSDLEIKEFIDSREVLTKRELTEFIYGELKDYRLNSKFINNAWDYALQTKNWQKMKEYQKTRIKYGNKLTHIPELLELSKTDKRLLEFGKRKLVKFLNEHYGIIISLAAAGRFLQQIRGKNA
jgi:hypothetical protein